jgi:hypothetical protein
MLCDLAMAGNSLLVGLMHCNNLWAHLSWTEISQGKAGLALFFYRNFLHGYDPGYHVRIHYGDSGGIGEHWRQFTLRNKHTHPLHCHADYDDPISSGTIFSHWKAFSFKKNSENGKNMKNSAV